MGNLILFIPLAVVAIAAAVGMVISRNAVHSALFLVVNFASVAVLYILLEAPFLAMVQVTVYAGAIMVLFLFVIMLLGAEQLSGLQGGSQRALVERGIAGVLALVLVVIFAIATFGGGGIEGAANLEPMDTAPQSLGLLLFNAYVLPFELTAVLLLAATIGVAVLSDFKKGGK
ncbi:MAG TPA: NADH-quinone oxidoreductase subunit J [Anaerolineae bacterium]|nr:NADH-quinone oxidoreductase subunit J [Anaerolineae bacterium]